MARARTKKVGVAFTVDVPNPLEATFDGDNWWVEAAGREVRLSNLEKVFWPEEGYTKGDLVAYYRNVADRILPYLAGRPLTMKRMPNGIDGSYFYEKSAPEKTPDWIPRCLVDSDNEKRVIDYLMVEDEAALLHVANLGCIEFHPLHARCGQIEVPDYLFFDLDPFEPASFEDVLAVARLVKVALDRLDLPSYPKISGATGMQIYVPIESRYTFEQTRAFVGAVGRYILKADPRRVTMEWQVSKRTGKVFIDHNMNRSGANIAAVYSVRPEPGGTVSTPVTWEEVEEGNVRPRDFTIATIHDRLASVGDLFRGVLEDPVSIDDALTAMGVPVQDVPPPTGSRRVDASGTGPKPAAKRKAVRTPRTAAKTAGRMSKKSKDAIARSKDPKLEQYLSMRDFEETPEPAGGDPTPRGDAFVIQKHNATRLHYDLRLERDGVMVSWAIPKGLPTVPGVKHLAVHTEDHPIEYNRFEGWIPEGHYGAGEVRIYDRGTFEPIEWTDTKVSFRLDGERHRGEWHLIKTNRDWLVFLAKASAAEQLPRPPDFLPTLAEAAREPFSDPGWRFEPKLDGIRTLAYITTDATRLVSRSGRDQTRSYPELARLAENVNALSAVIDGEIVAFDTRGRPSFEVLQQRMNLTNDKEIDKIRRKIPVTLFAFDLLWFDGEDLTGKTPLRERRERLEAIVTAVPPVQLPIYVDGEGETFYEACRELGFEGMMAKKLDSPYLPGRRTSSWRKVKILNRQDVVILGWTPGTGGRSSKFGALLVGAYHEGELRWVGQVGTGFTERMLDDLLERLRPLETDAPPIDDPALRKTKGAHWVRPEIVAEVEYLQQTKAGKLRAPAFKGLRPDKRPEECLLEPPAPASS
jgi:DNA ligase D-like protein (predicted ligase)/DNA ligase D-like protein (predicted polymerase)/DNA ligase D-like protein (predicted 3'-phosphoesterase)